MEDILAGELAMHFFFVNPGGLTLHICYLSQSGSELIMVFTGARYLSLSLFRFLSRNSLIVWRLLIIFVFPEVLVPEQKTHRDGRDKYEAGRD